MCLFCSTCFENLTEAEKESFRAVKEESRQKRREKAEKKQAERSLIKKQNLTKLEKIDLNFTAISDPESLHFGK